MSKNKVLHRPCKDCPFLKERAFKLTKERCEDLTKSLTIQDGHFHCHKTKDCVCAGATILLRKTDILFNNKFYRALVALNLLDLNKLKKIEDVYSSWEEFIEKVGEF